jgi:hypothetical protein
MTLDTQLSRRVRSRITGLIRCDERISPVNGPCPRGHTMTLFTKLARLDGELVEQ